MTTDANFGDSVYADGDDDAEYLDPLETLTGEDADEPLDTSYSPPDYQPAATRYGTTELEQLQGESLDQRIAQEEPDIDPYSESAESSEDVTERGSADPRAGRLVQPDEGAHSDLESEAIARDAGTAGYAASAEEAAVHIVDDEELDAELN
jgi:hypothetical protein